MPAQSFRQSKRQTLLAREGRAPNGAGRVPVGEPEPPELVVWHEFLGGAPHGREETADRWLRRQPPGERRERAPEPSFGN